MAPSTPEKSSWADCKFGSQANFSRLDLSNSTYYDFGRDHWVIARQTRYGQERSFGNGDQQLIPLPERLYAGGATSHRGFPINSAGPRDPQTGYPVGGAAVFVNTLELRTPAPPLRWVGTDLSFVLFHDMGNAFETSSQVWPAALRIKQPHSYTCRNVSVPYTTYNTPDTCDFNDFSHALGLGLRYHTPIGPIRGDFSYNLNPPIYPVFYDYTTNATRPTRTSVRRGTSTFFSASDRASNGQRETQPRLFRTRRQVCESDSLGCALFGGDDHAGVHMGAGERRFALCPQPDSAAHPSRNAPPIPSGAVVLDHVVAVINGSVILQSDVTEEMGYAFLQPFSLGGRNTPQRALQRLIDRDLILQQMETAQTVTPPTPEEVQQRIAQLRGVIPECLPDHCQTDAGWQAFLRTKGLTEKEVDAHWAQRMLILSFIQSRFGAGVRITSAEIADYYNKTLVPQLRAKTVKPARSGGCLRPDRRDPAATAGQLSAARMVAEPQE